MFTPNGDLFARRLNTPTALGQYAHLSEGTFTYPKLEGDVGSRMTFKGQEVICWSINNYLGLSNHPEVREVDAESARRYGMGYPMGARLLTGDTEQHDLLESELAEYVQKDACFLLNFGYQGVMSVVDALLDRHDAVVYDKEVHACTYDGIRMQQCGRYAFRHNDIADLERQLEKAYAKTSLSGGGILVIVEGVYGMRGHQGKLREVVALKERYNFRLLVDDAHGFGVLGETGAGTGEAQGVQDDIDLYFSTFTKSMSTLGAFIAGDADIISYLRYTTRSQIFFEDAAHAHHRRGTQAPGVDPYASRTPRDPLEARPLTTGGPLRCRLRHRPLRLCHHAGLPTVRTRRMPRAHHRPAGRLRGFHFGHHLPDRTEGHVATAPHPDGGPLRGRHRPDPRRLQDRPRETRGRNLPRHRPG